MSVVAITGHRPNKLGNDYDLTSPLLLSIKDEIREIVLTNNTKFMMSGMALGIDTLFAELALELKIPLIAAIPCTSQPNKWPRKSQERYFNIVSKAYNVINVSGNHDYKASYMDLRNRYMVDHCTFLIAVWNEDKSGGTYNCVQYAESVKRDIKYINPYHHILNNNSNNKK